MAVLIEKVQKKVEAMQIFCECQFTGLKRRMIMKNFLVNLTALCGVLVFAEGVSAEECQTAPDCAALGFTQNAADCSGAALKCPWDLTKAACGETPFVPYEANVLYGDGTISTQLVTDKTPIGVVFDEANRLAVALTDANSSGAAGTIGMAWQTYFSTYCDTPLTNCCTTTTANCPNPDVFTCDVDGYANTSKLQGKCTDGGSYPAAQAAYKYAPLGCSQSFCQKTKWFLPSMKELKSIYTVLAKVNNTLERLSGATKVSTSQGYWSSTEYSYSAAWYFHNFDGKASDYGKKFTYFYVRPVVKY